MIDMFNVGKTQDEMSSGNFPTAAFVQRSTATFLQIRILLYVCAPNSILDSCVITNALLQFAGETDLRRVQCNNSREFREDYILVSDVFECIHSRVRVTQRQDEIDAILPFEVHESYPENCNLRKT